MERDRLLLELETAGVLTSEISRFVLQDGDLILTSEKSGQSMRYRRVAGQSASPAGGESNETSSASSAARRVALTAEAVEAQIHVDGSWRGELLDLTQARVTLLPQHESTAPFRAELRARAKVSTYQSVQSVTAGGRQFTLVEPILVQDQELAGSYEGTATPSPQGVSVSAPPVETLVGRHRLDALGKLRRLLRLLPPITAVINAGRLHVPRGSEKLARGLRATPPASS